MIALLALVASSPLLDRAEAADAALERSASALRMRHRHIRTIKLWQTVELRGPAEERCAGANGEARAWARLAHWSGRAADADRAAEAQVEAEVCGPTGPADLAAEPGAPKEPFAPPATEALEAGLTIVLDPGHGGRERGAQGPDGAWEKDYNLDVARRLRALLSPRFRVVMTRDGDETVGLRERVEIANRSDAALFVSIHGNAHHQRRFHGIETYVLDMDSRRFPRRLAARDTELHLVEYPTETAEQLRDVELLLSSLAMETATRRSEDLAHAVQDEVVHALRHDFEAVRDLGLRQALFHVLLGARMPAVLVESGFLSHPVEGRRMSERTWRAAVATGLARGIERYVESQRGGWLAYLDPERSASMTHSISGSRGKSESEK